MNSINNKLLLYLALAVLLFFTIADGVNNYNSGVYADAHQLDGGLVGWFAPYGVVVFIVSALATFALGSYLFSRKSN
jgi:hypothetical protein